MTELQNNGITERQKDRQGKSSIAPTFSKRGYNYIDIVPCQTIKQVPTTIYGELTKGNL